MEKGIKNYVYPKVTQSISCFVCGMNISNPTQAEKDYFCICENI